MGFFKTIILNMDNKIKKINLNHSFIFFLFSNIFSLIILKLNNFNISPLICLLLILTIGVSHGSLDHVKGKKLLNILNINRSFSSLFTIVYGVQAICIRPTPICNTIIWCGETNCTIVIDGWSSWCSDH